MLEQLWFGEDDPVRAREEASESVAAAAVLTTGLKPFPVFAARAITLLAEPSFNAREVRALIERDQTIASRVMHTAGSAAFRQRTPIPDLGEAMRRLGSKELQAIIAAVATMEIFCDETGLSAKVRQHSSATAAIARLLAHGTQVAAEAFLCGLMHDIGKLMILQTDFAPYGEDGAELDAPDAAHACEREALRYDHALLGAFVLGEWGFGEPITTVVALHHQPVRAAQVGKRVDDLVSYVRLADRIEYVLRHYDGEPLRPICEALAADAAAARLGVDARSLESEWMELVKARREMLSLR
jgi:putative nucleotidyltransferase with HDIG domain